ncbi:hypothetical protein NPIL_110571 [Nephila pilipes]|uniref:Uncharacterized protein n=1 Tax=Nephila pilipes TaxID=299642 RepID=A0A8X6P725_NEPPI|nr:hypothetical protein NPIL_110571 [Nephila pilipes]
MTQITQTTNQGQPEKLVGENCTGKTAATLFFATTFSQLVKLPFPLTQLSHCTPYAQTIFLRNRPEGVFEYPSKRAPTMELQHFETAHILAQNERNCTAYFG